MKEVVYSNTISSLIAILKGMKKLRIEFLNKSARIQDSKKFLQFVSQSSSSSDDDNNGQLMLALHQNNQVHEKSSRKEFN